MKVTTLTKVLLATLLASALAVTASAGFTKKNTYNGSFSDVKQDAWYAKEVASAYELGFVEGVSDTAFSPDTTVTVAQGITMAARVHAEYNGKTITGTGTNWYDVYVKYAKDNGIIAENQFDSYTRELKRSEMAELFYDAMPEGYFKKINNVKYIPDVPLGAMYWDKLITLYNAGIVMGSDDYGSFKPDSSIVRSECAAIINRVAIPENRKTGELADVLTKDAYALVYNNGMSAAYEGINSGWVLDNRGGSARVNNSGFGSLGDISEEYATRYIREFNYIPNGRIVLELNLSAKSNGAYIEYKDVEENTVYMLKIVDGKWSILGKDGKYTSLVEAKGTTLFRVVIDLDNAKSHTYIDNVDCGEAELLSDNILSFVTGIDEKGTGSLTIYTIKMDSNYAVNENFDMFGIDSVYGWEAAEGAKVTNGELSVNTSTLEKKFDEVDGIVTFQTYFILRNGKDIAISLGDILKLESNNKKLSASGKELYTLTQNMWYRLKIEADTNTGKAKVWINGRVAGEVDLAKKAPVSTLKFETTGVTAFDEIMVYETLVHNDYVPAPEARATFDDYIVAMNICSLWRNGIYYGWACVSPYDEPKPVIGYYEEGVPETADWEIKYMTEHGIDVQSFCWFADVSTGPLKNPKLSQQLHEGFMYAKYSDYMKYNIQYEVVSSAKFDLTQFKNYVVPYWFENYFLDDRYFVIDNKPVLSIFSAETLAKSGYFGSVEDVKAAFRYLEEKAKEYGFDGVIILASGSASAVTQLGVDGTFAYSLGESGKTRDTNVSRIKSAASWKEGSVYSIPTMAVGFDSVAWHGVRHGMIAKETYKEVADYVVENLPKYNKPDWADNLLWLSTWNEFGEGHYIFPSGQNGFGYVDVLRGAFTDLKEEHEDVVPTISQMSRITHMYPQYARLLRRQGWLKYEQGINLGKDAPKNKLIINDRDIMDNTDENNFIPATLVDGKVYFPFNPASAVNYVLNCHYEWRKDAGTLKIMANGHEVKFLVGSDMYYKDGVLSKLGYTVTTLDGIPQLDFVKLAKDLEYKVEEKNGDVYIWSDTYESQFEALNDRRTGAWEFNLADTEGWTSTAFTQTVGGGTMLMETVSATATDPTSNLVGEAFPDDFYTKRFTDVEVRVRYKYNAGYANQITLYFQSDKASSWNEASSIKLQMPNTDSQGEWVVLKKSLAEIPEYQAAEYLTGIRLDPFNAAGMMEFDYIRFIEDPDFVYVEPEHKEFAIENGDAEDTKTVPFTGGMANVSIIAEPGNEKNHVYFVDANSGNAYSYFKCAAEFEPGATYKIEFDFKLVGNNVDNPDYNKTYYYCNLQYPDKTATNSKEHMIQKGAGTNNNNVISIEEGWVYYSAVHTIKNIDSNNGSQFTIFTNPTNGVGFDYYVDNITFVKLTEEESRRADPAASFDWATTPGIRYTFDSDAKPFVGHNGTIEQEDGALKLTATSGDPQAQLDNLSLDSEKYCGIAIKYRAEGFDIMTTNFECFFATDKEPNLDGNKMEKVFYSSYVQNSDGSYTVVFNLAANSKWEGTIKTLRLDPANIVGTFYFDEVVIIEN